MTSYDLDLRPDGVAIEYKKWADLLPTSDVIIAQIDAGLAPHEVFGPKEEFPANILVDKGKNFFDPDPDGPNGDAPLANLKRSDRFLSSLLEYPDHGVKTLSVLIGVSNRMTGIVPGAKVVPYRISNGPLFRRRGGPIGSVAETARIGQAIDHVLDKSNFDTTPAVITISMGNPGALGPLELFRQFLSGEVSIADSAKGAIKRAYSQGVIVVCAAGQIAGTVIQPAADSRTIAVGGFDEQSPRDYRHYPPEGFNNASAVDVWAKAQRVNRASFNFATTPPKQTYAEDPSDRDRPSGTSYAAPQVAGAAALWCLKHQQSLSSGAFKQDPWKIVEAFRIALRESSEEWDAKLPGRKDAKIRPLEVEQLLRVPLREPPESANRAKPNPNFARL